MKNLLAAIVFQLNPLSFPVAILILLGIRTAVGKDADPTFRQPKATDNKYITWIESYVTNGQPVEQANQYRRYCGYIGVSPRRPFDSSHPLSKVTIL
jgi:hypothetical protein